MENLQEQEELKRIKKEKRYALVSKIMGYVLVLVIGAVIGSIIQDFRAAGVLGRDNYRSVLTAANLVRNQSINEYTADEITDMMLTGLASYIEDDYSYYFTPEAKTQYDDDKQGIVKGGIGVQVVTEEDGSVLILDVYDDSPAQSAGIKTGDYIVAVDGVNVSEIDDLSSAISGENGTTVRITVRRGENELAYDVIRGQSQQTMVRYRTIGDVMYIQLKSFNGNAVEKFQEAMDAVESQDCTGIVLDLRDNGGGDLSILEKIGNMILPEGVIIYAQDRHGNRISEINSSGADMDLPMVILTNSNTASASEALAGAARDRGTAVLVGTKTFGKGIMQTTYTLDNEGAFKLTTAKYYLPSGECIHEIGLTPEYEAALPDGQESRPYYMTDQEDTQLQKALEILGQ
ncbi:MAG TPA: PDZ domain-containing protein [Firmicutes bacterium]|nr:PDZ domain-containing protein [Bacillota bacterium]